MRLVLMLFLALALGGCFPVSLPTGSTPSTPDSGVFDGSPADLMVTIQKDGMKSMMLALTGDDDDDEKITATIRVAKGNVYQVYKQIEIDPSDLVAQVAMADIPSSKGYEVSAVLHDGEALQQIGLQKHVDVEADDLTEVIISVAAPGYTLEKPNAVYSGGLVSQFRVRVDNPDLYALDPKVLVGLNPWTENGVAAMWKQNPGTGSNATAWLSTRSGERFPTITSDTTLYYQVEICSRPYFIPQEMLENDELPCWWDPDLSQGGVLATIPFKAGPPPED